MVIFNSYVSHYQSVPLDRFRTRFATFRYHEPPACRALQGLSLLRMERWRASPVASAGCGLGRHPRGRDIAGNGMLWERKPMGPWNSFKLMGKLEGYDTVVGSNSGPAGFPMGWFDHPNFTAFSKTWKQRMSGISSLMLAELLHLAHVCCKAYARDRSCLDRGSGLAGCGTCPFSVGGLFSQLCFLHYIYIYI